MRIKTIIDKLDVMYDQTKFYGELIPDVPEFLKGLADELRQIDGSEIVEAREAGAELGFKHASDLCIRHVIKNAELKTRGDMLAAMENLNAKVLWKTESKTEGKEQRLC